MTVEEGVKLVISGGIVSPPDARAGARTEPEVEAEDETDTAAAEQTDTKQ